MSMEKPLAVFSCVGGAFDYIPEAVNLMKQHFKLVTHQEFLQNPSLYSDKVQVIFLWNSCRELLPSLLGSLSALKFVANGGVGIDHLDVPHLNSLGVKVSNTPHVVSNATADMAMGLLLASARRIVEAHQMCVIENRVDPSTLMGTEVTGATLGIIGMGHIGLKIAQRGRGFDMKILYHNRNRRSPEDEQTVGATYCKNIEDLLREADFVVLAVNLTPQTTGLIGHKELSLMKPSAILVNISRGLVVDQDALYEALHKRTITAAALDVTYPEPLPRDHPLLRLPNIIITPHTGTDTKATTLKIVQMMVDNALAAVEGRPIPNEVKPM